MSDPIQDSPPQAAANGSAPAGTGSVAEALPGLVRIAAGAWWRTAGWTVGASFSAGGKVLRAASSGESAAQLMGEVRDGLRNQARDLLGLTDIEERLRGVVRQGVAATRPRDSERPQEPEPTGAEATVGTLRARGAELLRQSADVHFEEHAHPAYLRILSELAPDEGRILRLLALEGPQPAVDVRVRKPLNITSQLVAPGLSMIGAQAGCRYLERVPAYLNNLYRLGLIWFSRESLEDPLRYQVLEAQPDVISAMRQGGRGRTVRRSIHLTPFGEDFCVTCLPLETAELDALPGHPLAPDTAG